MLHLLLLLLLHLLGLARILAGDLAQLLDLLVVSCGVVDACRIIRDLLSLGLVRWLLTHVLVVSIVVIQGSVVSGLLLLVLLVHSRRQRRIVVQRFFARLLQRKVCTVRHLLGLVVLLRG